MENKLVKQENTELYAPMTIGDVKHQINLIQSLMKDVMKEDEHFGVIPGCGSKMVLLKAGAEKLSFVFRHTPKFKIEIIDLPNGHKHYSVLTEIYSRDGSFLGQGVGSCSTQESKYKYRWDDTGQDVPKKYWESRDQSLIGGDSYAVRKKDNKWRIFQRIEHDNPADYYNTCLKIAKKRSMVDAEITVCAASDIFTQDLEEGIVEAEVVKEDSRDETIKKNTQSRVEKELKKQSDENVKNATQARETKKTTKGTSAPKKTAGQPTDNQKRAIHKMCGALVKGGVIESEEAYLGGRKAEDLSFDEASGAIEDLMGMVKEMKEGSNNS